MIASILLTPSRLLYSTRRLPSELKLMKWLLLGPVTALSGSVHQVPFTTNLYSWLPGGSYRLPSYRFPTNCNCVGTSQLPQLPLMETSNGF